MKFIKFFVLFFSIFYYSCTTDSNSGFVNQPTSSRTSDDEGKLSYLEKDLHDKISKIVSLTFKNEVFQNSFLTELKSRGKSSMLAYDVLISSALNTKFKMAFESALLQRGETTISFQYFVETYLKNYPGMEFFLKIDDERNISEINALNDNFLVAFIYDEGDYIHAFKDGNQVLNFDQDVDPTELRIIINENIDHYVVGGKPVLQPTIRSIPTSILLKCDSLYNFLLPYNLNIYKHNTTIAIGLAVYENPLVGKNVFEINKVIALFNDKCGPPIVTPSPPSSIRTGCKSDRDAKINPNGYEHINQLRVPGKTNTLRACDKWCSWWSSDCRFQVDIIVPVRIPNTMNFTNMTPFIVKIIRGNETKLRNGRWVPIGVNVIPWDYLEGIHGDKILYNVIGMHRKSGTSSTMGINLSIMGGVEIFGVMTQATVGGTYSVTHQNKDCVLGNTLSLYCAKFVNPSPTPYGEFISTGNGGVELTVFEN